MLIASRIPMRVYRACALPLLLVSVASLAAVLVIGTGIGIGRIASVQKKYNGGMF